MKNNTSVETAQKSQATTKNNTPTGKVTLLKETEARKKAREEQYRNFRINALKRRCKRMGFDEAKTEEYVNKLIEQLNAPKEYSILVMFNVKDYNLLKEAVAKAKINYNILTAGTHTKARIAWGYMWLDGNQDILAKIREIAPPKAKIYPYAKKMESVLKDVERPPQEKKPTSNTAAVKSANKQKKKELHRCTHKKGKGKVVAKQQRKISLSERKKLRKATTVQLNTKKSSTASKKASSETLVPRRRMQKAA